MTVQKKVYKKVGKIDKVLADDVGLDYYGDVYISRGAFNHILKKHGKQFTKNIKENLSIIIERIIGNPDFVGKSKRRGESALRIVKKVDAYIMLVLEVDKEEGYMYVATMYPLTKSKLKNSIYSGSLLETNKGVGI